MNPLWWKAVAFAARSHGRQFRDDGATPYIAHPFRVSLIIRDVFGCNDEICLAAALLHDVLEDTPIDYDDLSKRFGHDVAGCVASLTKDMRLPEPEREYAYDEALARSDWRARLIKLADTYDNFCDIGKRSKRNKFLERCRRAIAIASPASGEHEAIPRAIAAVERLISSSDIARDK